jgi:membrane protein
MHERRRRATNCTYRVAVLNRPRLVTAFRLTLAAFRRHNASRFGAALAFYVVFSIAPALLLAIAIAGSVFGRDRAERQIFDRIGGSVGSAAGEAIVAMIRDAAEQRPGWIAAAVGVMTLIFGVSGIYRQIDDALKTIWGEARKTGSRLTSMILVFFAGMIVMLSVTADAAIAITGRYAAARLVGGEVLWHAAQLIVSTAVLSLLFAVVFRYLPRARVTWQEVGIGAAVTAVLFVIGKFALGIYLGKAAVGSAFGAAGSIVVVLIWSYWSAQIFFLGLEFTHVYSCTPTARPDV